MASDDFTIVNGDVRLRVEGLGKTLRQLSKAGADAQDMKDLMHEIGMMVVRAAKPTTISGKLSNSMRAGRGKTKAVVRAGGARIPYAGVIHFGWPARNIAPNPFFQRALVARRGAAIQKLERGIGEILRKNDLT
jgi:hypothetical protein